METTISPLLRHPMLPACHVDRERLMKRLGVLAEDTLLEVLNVLQAMFAV